MEKTHGGESKGTRTSESTSKNVFLESEGLTIIVLTREKLN